MIKRRAFIKGAGSLLIGTSMLSTPFAHAAIGGRLLYGYPPGAVGDDLANGLLPLVAAQQGPRYSLKNIDGRNTRQATSQAKGSPADGSTLLQVLSSSFTLQPHIYTKLDFDPLKDFEPIAMLGDFTYALTLGPAVPTSVTSVRSFMAWLRDNPEYRNIGVAIYGTFGHLALRIMARNNDVPLRGLPYKGSPAMLDDLNNGTLAAAFTVATDFPEKPRYTRLRCIAVTSRERLKYWPQVPTLYEEGFTDLDIVGWFGWFAPAGTPASVIAPMRERLSQVLPSSQYLALQQSLLMTGSSVDPVRIQARMAQESARYADLLNRYSVGRID